MHQVSCPLPFSPENFDEFYENTLFVSDDGDVSLLDAVIHDMARTRDVYVIEPMSRNGIGFRAEWDGVVKRVPMEHVRDVVTTLQRGHGWDNGVLVVPDFNVMNHHPYVYRDITSLAYASRGEGSGIVAAQLGHYAPANVDYGMFGTLIGASPACLRATRLDDSGVVKRWLFGDTHRANAAASEEFYRRLTFTPPRLEDVSDAISVSDNVIVRADRVYEGWSRKFR